MLALTTFGCAAPTTNLFVEPALGAPHAVVIVENDFQLPPGSQVHKTVASTPRPFQWTRGARTSA